MARVSAGGCDLVIDGHPSRILGLATALGAFTPGSP